MTSVGIIYKYQFDPARIEAQKLENWLRDRSVRVFSEEISAENKMDNCPRESSTIPNTVDWIVVFGGDGTLLGAARAVGKCGVPILGVNLGGLGFLTGISLNKLYPSIELILKGELDLENRIMLETKVIRSGEEICRSVVLNDVVINKGGLARIIELDVHINNQFLTSFKADGLIISTPTGSTAYNLSAGGPILYPTMENFVLTAICPFTLTNRPIILPDTDTILIQMGKASEEKVSLTFDGQVGFDFKYGDKVLINKSKEKIILIKPPDQGYFEILRAKLNWGGATYNRDGDN